MARLLIRRFSEWRGSRGDQRSCCSEKVPPPGISTCSRTARQYPDRPVTPRSNPGMHALSENSEFAISFREVVPPGRGREVDPRDPPAPDKPRMDRF